MKKLIKLVLGLAAGASLGILFAPKKGKDLRAQLAKSDKKFTDFANALIEASKDASGEVQKLLNSPDVQELLDSGKAKVDELMVVLKEHGDELSARAKQEFSEIMDKAAKQINDSKNSVSKKAKDFAKKVQKNADKTSKNVKKSANRVMKKVKSKISK